MCRHPSHASRLRKAARWDAMPAEQRARIVHGQTCWPIRTVQQREPTGEAQRADPRVEQLLDVSAEQLDGDRRLTREHRVQIELLRLQPQMQFKPPGRPSAISSLRFDGSGVLLLCLRQQCFPLYSH